MKKNAFFPYAAQLQENEHWVTILIHHVNSNVCVLFATKCEMLIVVSHLKFINLLVWKTIV